MTLYDKVKKVAELRKMPIYVIESRAGLANGTISKWKTSSPSVDNLKAVAEVLKVKIEVLI